MLNFNEFAKIFFPFLGGGLAGSIFTYFIGKRRERRIAKLEIALVPYITRDTKFLSDMLCYVKLTMKHCPQPIKWVEIIPKLSKSQQIQAWSSRLGLDCVVTKKNRVHFSNLRDGDIVNIGFLTPKSELAFDDSIDSRLLGINSDPHIHIQKTQSAWHE